jgi:hypothetical protein
MRGMREKDNVRWIGDLKGTAYDLFYGRTLFSEIDDVQSGKG